MKKIISILIIMILLISSFTSFAQTNLEIPKEKYKIAYLENDPYFNYTGTFYGVIRGLYKEGIINTIDGIPYSEGEDDSSAIWKYLSNPEISDYLNFNNKAFYQLYKMSEKDQEKLIYTLNNTNDYDLVIVLGTKAGKFAASNISGTPIMVFSTSNAIGAGITASSEDSGKDNVWAHVDTKRYLRQLKVFYDIFKFKTLGIVFEDSESGRVQASYSLVKEFTAKNNIKLIEKHVNEPISNEDQLRYDSEVKNAYKEIANKVDAFYLTTGARDTNILYDYLDEFYKNKIPVFSQVGSAEVKKGALMSVYRFNYDEIGYFGADRIIKVLGGQLPRKLGQEFGETPSISINIEVAEKIGYKPSLELLLIIDTFFKTIAK